MSENDKLFFLKDVHEFFLELPVFSIDYTERYFVFAKDVSGRERPKGVRKGFISINCFYNRKADGSFCKQNLQQKKG